MPSKLQKFDEFNQFSNSFHLPLELLESGFPMKGKWREEFFKNNNPIVLELGCGKGEYSIGLAARNANKNYIGVDIKGNRMWTGAKQALDSNMLNVAFLRTRIDFIQHCFEKDEVDEIWITFPDPQPQKGREKKRLTCPIFLKRYFSLLKPNGIIHLKTDNTGFYEYTLEVIAREKLKLIYNTNNLYENCPQEREELIQIKTYYEKLFTDKGENIKYCCFGQ